MMEDLDKSFFFFFLLFACREQAFPPLFSLVFVVFVRFAM